MTFTGGCLRDNIGDTNFGNSPQMQQIYSIKPKIREHFHFLRLFLISHKRYGIQVNIHIISSMPDRVMNVLLYLEVTPDIDLDSMKYKN